MTPGIMIRLDIERMRYSVVHAFMEHTKEIETTLGDACDRALKDFDFDAIVKQESDVVIREAVKSAISHAVSKMMWEKPIHDIIKAGAERKVREAIEESLK